MLQRRLKAEEYEGYCEYCHEDHRERDLVPVIGGEVIGQYSDPEPHLGVTGVEKRLPDVEFYCPHRYASEFGTEPEGTVRKNFNRITYWVTWKNAASFTTGVVITALLFLFLTP